MPEQQHADVSQRLGVIAEQLEAVAHELWKVTGYGKRTRRLTILAICSFLLDIALTLAFFFTLHVSQVNTCDASNEARHGQIIIWHTIVEQFSDPHQTAKQRLQQERFLHFVDTTFHQINCPHNF